MTVSTNSSAVSTPRNSSCHSRMFDSHATCRACPLRIKTESSSSSCKSETSSSESESESMDANGNTSATTVSESSSDVSVSFATRALCMRRAVLFAVARHAAFTSGSAAMPLSAMRCISPVRICSSIGNTSFFRSEFEFCVEFCPFFVSPIGSTTVCSARYPLSLGVAM